MYTFHESLEAESRLKVHQKLKRGNDLLAVFTIKYIKDFWLKNGKTSLTFVRNFQDFIQVIFFRLSLNSKY